jgi:hypothetical protein
MTLPVIIRWRRWSILARIDSILLGDNPFFGVDHLSQERAREKASKSQAFSNIIDVIDYCFSAGANGMVVSTNPKLRELLLNIKAKQGLVQKLVFNPILPYAQGYVVKVNEKGLVNTLMEILSQASLQDKFKILAKSGIGAMTRDFYRVFKAFIDLELLPLQETRMGTVFLHDVITDLALALDLRRVFETFQEYIHDAYGKKAGFVTKNFPLLVNALNEWNLRDVDIMTSFNSVGFQMNPSKHECEHSLLKCNEKVIAMSILAGGYIEPLAAKQYISSLPSISTVVIGISSIEHAKETLKLFLD